jgi:GNAT superfamily N-acetyltransferase
VKIVRKALISDAEPILKVQNQGWLDTFQTIIGTEKVKAIVQKRTVQEWQKILQSTNTITYVIENNERQVVGFAGCGPKRESMDGFPGEIYGLYVLKAYHRTGCGKALFQASADYLKSRNLIPFAICTFSDNPACRFYEKMGGSIIKTCPSPFDSRILDSWYGFKI